MDTNKLQPVLTKESILKTANADELGQSPQDVLQRYQTYALTHVPLGETSKQLANLQRVITVNKTCAIGTIVGPYGYGKTSTAVHLWHELRGKQILAIPPFQWVNLQQLVNAVYHWIHFEFSQGPKNFINPLDNLYDRYKEQGFERLGDQLDDETKRDWFERGLLNLELRPEEVVRFFSEACDLCKQAGYKGLAIFTDELQVTVADYKPSRDQFFNDLFQIVKDTLDKPGNWALLISMDDGTEGIISRLRADLTQRMQSSALYFRVRDVYNRREYPAELWTAFEKRFGFDGNEVILPEALESIGQIASREDLGAGPRMVTNALSLAVKHYEARHTPYTPLNFVDDFLAGQVLFDQRGKFSTAVKKALDNKDIQSSAASQQVVKLLAAFPAGCPEATLSRFDLLDSFQAFPPLARRDLISRLAEGHTLRLLLEDERPPEPIEQRLIQEFVSRFTPGKKYAQMAAEGFLKQVLLSDTFRENDWKAGRESAVSAGQTTYRLQPLVGSFDKAFPQREVTLAVTAVRQSSAPTWQKLNAEAEIELHFELNYELSPTEPSQLLVAPERPEIAVFQFNLQAAMPEVAHNILPDILFDYYPADKLTPLLCLALLRYIFGNSGDTPADKNRIRAVAAPLRQYILTVLLGEHVVVQQVEFESPMVGHERVKELFRVQCRALFPIYKTLIISSTWQQNLQQYSYALERIVNEEGVAVARGLRSWETTKNKAADAFRIPKLSLTRLETLLDGLGDLIVKEDYAGRNPDSPIRLRFHLHPLETQWLELLDNSQETARHNGMNVPAIYAVELLRQTKQQGYKSEEMQAVLLLMQKRQLIAFDQRQGLLLRAVDAIDDLKAAVQEQLEKLRSSITQLETRVPEFDSSRFPLSNLENKLVEAKARDELELLKNEIRQHINTVQVFANSRATARQEDYSQEINKLNQYIQQGVPEWLSRPYAESPLQNVLEQQRHQYAGAYEDTLREIRQLVGEARTTLQQLPNASIEKLLILQKTLPELRKSSERLQIRRQSYADHKDDLNAWRQIIDQARDFQSHAQAISKKYGTAQWDNLVRDFWQRQQTQLRNANPLTIAGLHREFQRQLTEARETLNSWLENQREDFERQRYHYEQTLIQAGLPTRLRIPFDQQRPEESYSALTDTVFQELSRYLTELQNRLYQVLQKTRYAMQVQRVDLASVEMETKTTLKAIEHLQHQLTPALLRDIDRAEQELLQPIGKYSQQQENLATTVQQALQKQTPSAQERQLLELLQANTGRGEVDLYSLIMLMIDREEPPVELSELMGHLKGLFQKNQIGMRIRVL